jgi:hypothetical protein
VDAGPDAVVGNETTEEGLGVEPGPSTRRTRGLSKRVANTSVDRFIMRQRERRRARALIADERERRGNACEACGTTGPLHWHHRDPASKSFKIAGGGARVGRAPLERELAKCLLLCRRCHDGAHMYLRRTP